MAKLVERAFWHLVKIMWYAAMAFVFGLALILMDRGLYLSSYISMAVAIMMTGISAIANR